MMQTMKIGRTDMTVSRVSLGTLSIGGESVWGHSDETESLNTIARAREIGINFFDTAPVYGFGRSERILGRAVGNKRDDYIISSKVGLVWDLDEGPILYERDGYTVRRNLTAANIKREIDLTLHRLNMDHIDIYYTHWQSIDPFLIPIEETMGALCDLKKEGKIRAIGASNVSKEQIEEYLKYGRLDVIQNRLSMLDQTAFREVNQLCLENDITYHAYSPFERGLLTGAVDMNFEVKPGDARSAIHWYQPEQRRQVLDMLESWKPLCEKYGCSLAGLVVAWTLALAPNINVDAGSRRVKTIEENAYGGTFKLTQEELDGMNAQINYLLDKYAAYAKAPR